MTNEEKMMRVLNGRIEHARSCADGNQSVKDPATQWAWRCVQRQLENLRTRYRAIARKKP